MPVVHKKEQKCGMCWRQEHKLSPATHKVAEVVDADGIVKLDAFQHLCHKHFLNVFGIQKNS